MDSGNENPSKRRKWKPQEDHQPRNGMDDLPTEIAVDILSRLPIRSLMQFRFVCRAWHNLSLDPQLFDLHLSRTVEKNPCLIFHTDYPIRNQLHFVEITDGEEKEKVRKIHTPFCGSMPEFNVVGSCNGLLCLSDSLFDDALYIYNPFTGNYRALPKYIHFQDQQLVYGFGFHPITNEYKVVRIIYYRNSKSSLYGRRFRTRDYPHSEVQVYSLGSSSWRSLGKAPYQLEGLSSEALVNGRLHWLSLRTKFQGFRGRVIVSFDVADEQFRVVPGPDCGDLRRRNYHLAVLRGCLSAAVYCPYGKLEVWVMKEYSIKESWTKEYSVGSYLPKLSQNLQHSSGIWMNATKWRVVRMLCLLKNGQILLEYKGGILVSYDPNSRKFSDLVFQGMPSYFRTIIHVGSLNWIQI